jgi:hypothetical protein
LRNLREAVVTSQPFHFPLEEDALELARDRARVEGVIVGVYRDTLGFFVSAGEQDADRVHTAYVEARA